MAWREEYQTKKGTKYRIRWMDGGKQRHKKAGFLRSTAKDLIREVEDAQVLNKPILSLSQTSYYIQQYLKMMKETLRPNTERIARFALKAFDLHYGNRPLDGIQPQEIEAFKNSLLGKRHINGINIILRNLKTFYAYCVKNGYLIKNPAEQIKQFKRQPVAKFLERKELAKLYAASSKELRRAIFVLYRTGMRVGEYLSIKKGDVHSWYVVVSGKTGRRTVSINPLIAKMIKRSLGRWNLDSFEKAFRMAVKRSEMGRIRVHDLRHTWASMYLKNGGSISQLKELGGWRSLQTLGIYVHPPKTEERYVRLRL